MSDYYTLTQTSRLNAVCHTQTPLITAATILTQLTIEIQG